MAKKSPTPKPVPVAIVCSLCGESWDMHREVDGTVTSLECIRLLKEKAARAERRAVSTPYVPYIPVVPYNPRPWWGGTISYPITVSSTGTAVGDYNTYKVPVVVTASPQHG